MSALFAYLACTHAALDASVVLLLPAGVGTVTVPVNVGLAVGALDAKSVTNPATLLCAMLAVVETASFTTLPAVGALVSESLPSFVTTTLCPPTVAVVKDALVPVNAPVRVPHSLSNFAANAVVNPLILLWSMAAVAETESLTTDPVVGVLVLVSLLSLVTTTLCPPTVALLNDAVVPVSAPVNVPPLLKLTCKSVNKSSDLTLVYGCVAGYAGIHHATS